MSEITIETLGHLRDHGMGLNGHCGRPDCGAGGALPLDALIDRYGADHVYIGDRTIRRALKCTRCGHAGGSITVSSVMGPQVIDGAWTGR